MVHTCASSFLGALVEVTVKKKWGSLQGARFVELQLHALQLSDRASRAMQPGRSEDLPQDVVGHLAQFLS
jgi:hypothetical protein